MAVIRTRALVLRHTTDREHDRLLLLLTPQHGQLRVRARGTKKSVSKLGGSLEPLLEVDCTIADGRTLGLITGSVVVESFGPLRRDLISLTMAQWLMELVAAITKPGQPGPKLYDQVQANFRAMMNEVEWSAGRRWLALCRRALRLLQAEGFAPLMTTCAICHQPLKRDDWAYQPDRGFVHFAEGTSNATTLSTKLYDFLATGSEPEESKVVFAQLHRLVEQLTHQTLDRPLQSERVLQSVVRQHGLPKR